MFPGRERTYPCVMIYDSPSAACPLGEACGWFCYRSFIFNNLCLVNLLPQIGKFFSGERKIIRLKLKNRSAENDLSSSVRA